MLFHVCNFMWLHMTIHSMRFISPDHFYLNIFIHIEQTTASIGITVVFISSKKVIPFCVSNLRRSLFNLFVLTEKHRHQHQHMKQFLLRTKHSFTSLQAGFMIGCWFGKGIK